jgi:2,3-bisphosphoglycerate-independent phosphoglycerate mutase
MHRSREVLAQHPVNKKREEKGARRATAIWLWGQGRAPALPTLKQRFGIDGAVISAVDIINGLGVYAGLERIKVPGATGFFDTNYKGKGEYGVAALERKDLIFIHVEAPDEAGHMGAADKKIEAIENFDAKVVGTVVEKMTGRRDWRLLLLPDHPTPIALKTHVAEPVPFIFYSAEEPRPPKPVGYNERDAAKTGVVAPRAHELIDALIGGKKPWTETSR